MRYTGSFSDIMERRVTVEIITSDGIAQDRPLGSGSILFSDDPVSTTSSYNGPDDVLERESCTLRFLIRNACPDLFGKDWCDTKVTVTREGVEIFKGYAMPFSYTQPYNELYDEIQIECHDLLGVLQGLKYGCVGRPGVDYSALVESACVLDFDSIIIAILSEIDEGDYIYDDSRRPDSTEGSTDLLSSISVDERLFYGSGEDDVWTMEEVLTEILRYLNLKICRHNGTFHIHAADSVWGTPRRVQISRSNVWGSDASLTYPEMYNRISVRAELSPVEELVSDPLAKEDTVSVYPKSTLWCTEYMAFNGWDFMRICGLSVSPDPLVYKGWRRDYWVKVLDHPNWTFSTYNTAVAVPHQDFYATHFRPGIDDQSEAINRLGYGGACCLVELTHGQQDYDRNDNGIASDSDTDRYLLIGVGGDGISTPALSEEELNSHQQELMRSAPLATFESGELSLSPVDANTTRYLVISGTIRMNPVHNTTMTWRGMKNREYRPYIPEDYETSEEEASAADAKNKRYFARRYWKGDPAVDNDESLTNFLPRLIPPVDDDYYNKLEFKYSAQGEEGEEGDRVSDLPLIACMLIVGDKCLVQHPATSVDRWSDSIVTDNANPGSEFSWEPYKTLEECGGDKTEYFAQSFWLGIDPAIGDFIIGPEHDIRNNIHYKVGLGVSGMAIPVKQSDQLKGKVTFHILGPYNQVWDEITRRHPTFFRHTQWTSNSLCLLEYVSSIWIKDFEIRIVSDNAGDEPEEGDIVYISDTTESFINEKEEEVMRVNSALTDAERRILGVPDTVSLSTVQKGDEGLLSIYDAVNEKEDKPECLYVDWFFREQSRQRVQLTQGMKDFNLTRCDEYEHPAMPGKLFRCVGISRNLREASASVILEEK